MLLTHSEPSLRSLAKRLLERGVDNYCEAICLEDVYKTKTYTEWAFTLLVIDRHPYCMAKLDYSTRERNPFGFRFEDTRARSEDADGLARVAQLWAKNPDSFFNV